MDLFSNTLRGIINQSNIKIQLLAKESGVDRTLIQKMIKGDRIPADKEILEKLIDALMLSQRQIKQLREAYHICRIGEETYQRHLLVKDMLEGFCYEPNTNAISIISKYEHSFMNTTDHGIFYGPKEIKPLLKAVIEAEASSKGMIKMLIQPEYEFLAEILAILGEESHLQIEHIFCLQEQNIQENYNKYNLNCIKNIIPILISGCEYNPYIYYEDISSHLNNASIFPYIIITQTQVVTLSYDFNTAILYQNTSFQTLFSSVFHSQQRRSIPLMCKIKPLLGSYEHYLHSYTPTDNNTNNSSEYSLYGQPRFAYFCDSTMIERYVIDDSQKERLLLAYEQQFKNCFDLIEPDMEYTFYFTLDGIEHLWNYGRLKELPDELYRPLNKKDCLTILKRLYEKGLSSQINYYFINKEVFKIPNHLIISAARDNSISIIYTPPQKDTMHYQIKEKSLATSLCSYLKFLKHSDAVYTKEITLELLKNQIDIYTNELSLLSSS